MPPQLSMVIQIIILRVMISKYINYRIYSRIQTLPNIIDNYLI